MSKSYSADAIEVMEGLEPLQLRPAMYIGNTDNIGLHHLAIEIISNSIDEYARGVCTDINVVITKDGYISIEDNGGGIPVAPHKKYGIPTLQVLFTVMNSTGKLDNSTYGHSIGLHGIGCKAVCALSDDAIVTVHREGKVFRQRYSFGKVLTPVEEIGKSLDTGTIVKFKPSPKIFKATQEFKFNQICDFCLGAAYITRGLKFTVTDERTGEQQVFYSKGGITELLDKIAKETERSLICKPFYFTGEGPAKEGEGTDKVEIVLAYHDKSQDNIRSYVNYLRMINGGTHEQGFRTGLTRVINKIARDTGFLKDKDQNFEGSEVLEGLMAVVSVKMGKPEFEGQTKAKVNNPELVGMVSSSTYSALELYLTDNPKEANIILNRIMKTRKQREEIRKIKDANSDTKKSMVDKFKGKLADCSSHTKVEDRELLICEGNSAAGSAKQGRDVTHQAILPIRGKIANVEKKDLVEILKNEEVRSIINAIGAGYLDTFDIKKMRYGKIIIMTDRDLDGSHIRTLLTTLFFRLMPEIIQEGKLYSACPPLYRVIQGKKITYFDTDNDKDRYVKELKDKGITNFMVTRFKGLTKTSPEKQ